MSNDIYISVTLISKTFEYISKKWPYYLRYMSPQPKLWTLDQLFITEGK